MVVWYFNHVEYFTVDGESKKSGKGGKQWIPYKLVTGKLYVSLLLASYWCHVATFGCKGGWKLHSLVEWPCVQLNVISKEDTWVRHAVEGCFSVRRISGSMVKSSVVCLWHKISLLQGRGLPVHHRVVCLKNFQRKLVSTSPAFLTLVLVFWALAIMAVWLGRASKTADLPQFCRLCIRDDEIPCIYFLHVQL